MGVERKGVKTRRTRIINVYNNHLREDQVWVQRGDTVRRQALADVNWDRLMRGRVILLGDFNVPSPEWNLPCGEKRDARGLEALIEEHDLIFNSKPGRATKLTQRDITSIIDLTFTTAEIGALDTWVIVRELATSLDHGVIVYDLVNVDNTVGGMGTSQEVTG